MKIICAGLSKTGTKSIANALRMLGFIVYDGPEHLQYHMAEYDQAFSTDKMPDFASMYSKVDAVTDIPACLFWKELKETFPDAKVVLMERDSASDWVKSLTKSVEVAQNLIMKKPWNLLGVFLTPTGRRWSRVWKGIEAKGEFPSPSSPNKIDLLHQTYLKHNARVKASIPRDDLLVYNVKEGWKPLCDFLGVEVPDVPFPRLNAKSDMVSEILESKVFEKIHDEMVFRLVVLVMTLAVLIYLLMLYI